MSSTYSQESAASPSDLNEPECEPSRSARSIPSADASSPSTGPASLAMPTCEALPGPSFTQAEFFPMSSAAVSLAKMSASPAHNSDWTASARDFGRKSLDLLANYDRVSSSWKTSQICLDSDLAELSGTWPRSGMTRNGTAYQRLTLVPGTVGTEFGWLPTPTKTADAKGSPKNRYYGSPTCRSNLREWLRDGPDDPIFPHPAFVELVMGYPIGWTELEASEIRSSRKSPSLSGERS